jgi:2-deoxy-D-gluconate 3-dehydrogenase
MSILENFSLAGATAMVTGCRRGIGKAIAIAMAEAGADIIGVSASLEADSEVEMMVRELGRTFVGHQVDLSDRAAIRSLVKSCEAVRIDILVNNAGIIRRQPAAEHSDDYWDDVMAVNLTAPFLLAKGIGRQMLARGRGKIIFIASLLSFQGGLTVPGYAASKGGIAQLTKALANEWASRGVNVNAIAPGYFATDNTAPLRADAERNAAILDRIPAGRWGEARDLAGAAVFLASPASKYIHGTVLTVDGGWMGR